MVTRKTAAQKNPRSSKNSRLLLHGQPSPSPSTQPRDLLPRDWQDIIKKGGFELPKNIIDKINKTIVLNARQPYIKRSGELYLAFINPLTVDPFASYASFNEGKDVSVLWLIFPSGKRLSLDFAVQSEKAGTHFHINMVTPASTTHHVVESTGNGQHLSFSVDARADGFYGFDVSLGNHKNISLPTFRYKPWSFFKCAIMELG